MVANWAAARAKVVAAVDGVHGENVRIEPKGSASQYGHAPADTARPPFERIAVLRIEGGEESLGGDNVRSGWKAGIATGKAELHIDPKILPEGMELHAGDIVVALDRGSARYEMLPFEPRSLSRWVIPLTLRSAHAQSPGA